MEKKFTVENMNGDTQNDEKSCSLDDMNCLNEDKKGKEEKFAVENMNGDTQNDEKSCSLDDMNCLDENKK